MWNGMAFFELCVQLDVLALVNMYSATAMVKLGADSRIQGNVLEIQHINVILLEGQRKQQNSLCLGRDSKFRPSEYMSGHL
jgi:1,4-dihydroxy-2-naphthoyl-CoA synthase